MRTINVFKFLLSFCIMAIATSLNAAVGVYLENNYGAKLNYKTSSFLPEGQYVGNNVRVFLGDVNFISELSIRTTGAGSSYVSYYYDLMGYIGDIKRQQAYHPNEDAILAVEPSRVNWYIVLRWEQKTKGIKPIDSLPKEKEQPKPEPQRPQEQPIIIPQPKPEPVIQPIQKDDAFEKEEALLNLNTGDERLNAIKNGALGQEFAHKAKAICDANYTNAEKLGKINLCARLKVEVVAPQFRQKRTLLNPNDPDDMKRSPALEKYGVSKRRPVRKDLAPAIDEIKSSINRLYNVLAGYKSRGEAE
ncbi:MAG TPA: hypothetical protein VKU36_01700 [Candidatus Babeliales bacterium]|nr:hypothetical protein [Candidatus Babeliales bacterium]